MKALPKANREMLKKMPPDALLFEQMMALCYHNDDIPIDDVMKHLAKLRPGLAPAFIESALREEFCVFAMLKGVKA